MRTFKSLLAGSLVALTPASLCAQEFDMQLLMKWEKTKVVAYAITGVYSAETTIAYKDISGQVADVTDRITIDITWDIRKRAVVGNTKFENFPSRTTNPRNLVASCPPPRLKGDYEHFNMTAVVTDGTGLVGLTGTTTYPAVDLVDCAGATEKRTVGGKQEKTVVYLPLSEPTILAYPPMTTNGKTDFSVAPDKKSFTIKQDEWTWTFIPTHIS